MLGLPPQIGLTCCCLGFEDVILTSKNAGVKAVDVERLRALLVGVTRADRCLTEREETRVGSSNVCLLLTCYQRTCISRRDKLHRPN